MTRTPTHNDLVSQAQAAQRTGDWTRAAALWRQEADTCDDERQRHGYLKQAAWCEDMNALREEDESV